MHRDSSLFPAMTLLATLGAATKVAVGIRERKAGLDPSGQESEDVVRQYLKEAVDTSRRILLQLRASLVVGNYERENGRTTPVRRFSELQQMSRLVPIFQRIHQRLLSLYPHVSDELAEEAREVFRAAEFLIEAAGSDSYETQAEAFIERGMQLCSWISLEIVLE